MGWTSSPRYYNPTVLRRIYATEFNPEKVTVVGWCGGWLKCINKLTDRPFLVCVLVRRFGKNEYGYKDIESTSGPCYFNQAAVKWLKRELAKRNMAPYNIHEANLILRHERLARANAAVKSLKPGDPLTVVEEFDCTDGYTYKVGTKFTFDKLIRGRIRAKLGSYHCFRLPISTFFKISDADYPIVAVK